MYSARNSRRLLPQLSLAVAQAARATCYVLEPSWAILPYLLPQALYYVVCIELSLPIASNHPPRDMQPIPDTFRRMAHP
ncbi:hypothetical protein BO99DRAFT_47085 [Aspergillus violaceofuscus CBS 115571]|uniref:Uncharacterized protein n=1 Tax=Aspergillus violaceofuscus (strain CBS 115571) TaxID=1450538 RepID=A0A2V5GRD3_ASPV1|nr:hypothetical protein BO99DRAFT_47085 [Aspergillus violaceofuscus CBS 115571]